jgi:hypothetical protein
VGISGEGNLFRFVFLSFFFMDNDLVGKVPSSLAAVPLINTSSYSSNLQADIRVFDEPVTPKSSPCAAAGCEELDSSGRRH